MTKKSITLTDYFGWDEARVKEITGRMVDILSNYDEEYDASPADDRAHYIEKIRDFDRSRR